MFAPTLQGEVGRLSGEGQHDEAVELITEELRLKPDNPNLFLLRAQNLLRREQFKEAGDDAVRAVELGGGPEAYLVHGKALFNQGLYLQSLEAFKKGKTIAGSQVGRLDQLGQWITWCEGRIKKLNLTQQSSEPPSAQQPTQAEPTQQSSQAQSTHQPQKAESRQLSTPAQPTEEPGMEGKQVAPAAQMPSPKIKHDWYQTETHVVITILLKGQQKEDVNTEFTDTSVSVSAPLASGSEYSLMLDLCHPINPAESSFKVVPSKIEVKLKKLDGIRWSSLEGDGSSPSAKVAAPQATASQHIPSYPSSSMKKHDWNKLEADMKKEEEEEKLEGDAALNQLFQKIYGEGSEETRRAMSESGGTVLSTNWKEVASQKVDVKPPDGLEFRKWDQ